MSAVPSPTMRERVLLMTIVDASRARGNPRGDSFEPIEALGIIWMHAGFGEDSLPRSFKAAFTKLVELELITIHGSKVLVTDAGRLTAARWKERHRA